MAAELRRARATTRRRQAGCSSPCRVSTGWRSRPSSRAPGCSSRGSARSRRARASRSCSPARSARRRRIGRSGLEWREMEAGAQPLARARAFALSPAAFRRLALANAAMLVLIVATGATVRLTGSGLGCEHWPGCAQHHFEPKSYHSYIEFSNRVIAFFTILVTLATWLLAAAPAVARVRRLLRDAAAGAARRADRALPPQPVARPLALPALDRRADARRRARDRDASRAHGRSLPAWVPRVGLLVGVAALVLIVSGTFATASGPHPGSAVVRRLWSFQPAVYWHVRATAVFGVSFALLLVWLVRNRGAAGARRARAARAARGADGGRRDAVPHAPAVVARARPRDPRGDGVGRGHGVRLQPLAPA